MNAGAAHQHGGLAPSPWVTRWAALLPTGASALDLACGSGRHARWLAERGIAVTALDRNAAAVDPLRQLPGIADVVVADIENEPWPLAEHRFDAIVVTNYLWRPLWPLLAACLAPGGLLVYETFNVDQASIGKPSNPAFLLEHGELLAHCTGWRVLGYEDGFLDDPARHVQRIAAIKPVDGTDDASSVSAPPRRYPL